VAQSSSVVENVEHTTRFVIENVTQWISQDVLADADLLCSKGAMVRVMINITLCMLRISYVFFLLYKPISIIEEAHLEREKDLWEWYFE
jgi:hypothetical protein